MNICMVGTGYVGLVSGACFADFGMNVICVDKDAAKVRTLRKGRMPIFEPGLEELVRGGLGISSKLCRQYGRPLSTSAKMTDVPEHTWMLATLLHHAGVEFMVIGCNTGSAALTIAGTGTIAQTGGAPGPGGVVACVGGAAAPDGLALDRVAPLTWSGMASVKRQATTAYRYARAGTDASRTGVTIPLKYYKVPANRSLTLERNFQRGRD